MINIPNADMLEEQAARTASFWLSKAVKEIDGTFGEGYAEKHPELIGHFLQAAALDQAGMYLRAIAERLNYMDFSVSVDTDNIADSLGDVANSLDSIAENMKK